MVSYGSKKMNRTDVKDSWKSNFKVLAEEYVSIENLHRFCQTLLYDIGEIVEFIDKWRLYRQFAKEQQRAIQHTLTYVEVCAGAGV